MGTLRQAYEPVSNATVECNRGASSDFVLNSTQHFSVADPSRIHDVKGRQPSAIRDWIQGWIPRTDI